MVTPPASLLGPDLAPLWDATRDRLERKGAESRGRLRTPELSTVGRHRLTSLLGRPISATLDLAELEAALVRVGAGRDLVNALDSLGHAMSFESEQRRTERRIRKAARESARATAAEWPEPWATSWVDEVIQAGLLRGLDVDGAAAVVTNVRRCLDVLGSLEPPASRVDLAASVLGDSHALDSGARLGAAMMRALRQRFAIELYDDTDRTVWDRAGAPSDSVSAPALTWNLPVLTSCALTPIIATATTLGIVAHLSQMALRTSPLAVPSGTVVLVTENPRIVEAAAQRRSPLTVVSTNGNPSTAVRLLLDQLLALGVELRYHGDFDAAGLSICRRMSEFGLRPWHMNVEDYGRAVASAHADGVDLPIDKDDPGPTPWDDGLRDTFRACRRVVHEERLLDELLAP